MGVEAEQGCTHMYCCLHIAIGYKKVVRSEECEGSLYSDEDTNVDEVER